jgi:hypothetical protein
LEQTSVLKALSSRAKGDSYALVREACLEALAPVESPVSRDALRFAAEQDNEPRVRRKAQQLMSRPLYD